MPAPAARKDRGGKPEPDWTHVHRELRRPGVTLMLLWEEYRRGRTGRLRLQPLVRALPRLGGPAVADDAPGAPGRRAHVCRLCRPDRRAGRRPQRRDPRRRRSSSRCMGASSYTYAEASWTQTLPDWIGSHVRALAFMGGVPAQLVPDNPKVGVTRANWYEPGLNRTYLDLATHYGTAILPARPRKPRDKAKVEVGVLVVERWILARLRNRRFFSLGELNQAIGELVATSTPGRCAVSGVSRRDLFVELDRPALQATAGRALRLRRVASAPGRPRLPCRHRRPLLLGAAPADPRAARGAHHRAHHRAVPQRRARRRPSARRRPRPAHDRGRAHAEFPSALRRVDHRAHPARGGSHRPEHRQARRPDPGQPAAPRAGLPRLPRHPAPGAPVRCRSARGGLRSRARHRRPLLRLDPLDPQERARSAAAPSPPGRASWRCPTTPTSAVPATTIEEIMHRAHPSHPRSAASARPRRHGPRLCELEANPTRAELSHAEWLGLLLDRETTERYERRLEHGCVMPGYATRPPSRMSTTALPAASTAHCSRRLIAGALDRRGAEPDHRRADRRRQKLAGLRARPQGLPRQPLGPLSARAADVQRSRAGPRRRPLSPADARPRRGQAADPRRLGSGAARTRAASRPPRDRRGALRPRRHPDHQPDPGRPLARPDRRADPRRRHPRPHRPQRPSPPADQRATRHPGRHQSERPADFDRNRWPTSIRNARPTSSESAQHTI